MAAPRRTRNVTAAHAVDEFLDTLPALVRDENAGPDTVIPPGEVRELPRVALTSALDDALALLRRTSSHLGGVVDATGTVVGIVALEDLVEEFVGTVRDATHRIADPGPGHRTP